MNGQNVPPMDSKDYTIKILSERCQLFEKNIRTLAGEIARLNQLKNGNLEKQLIKEDKKDSGEVVIDINKNKDQKTNAVKAQKLLAAPEEKKPVRADEDEKENVVEEKPEKPAEEKKVREADGNVKEPDTSTETETPADHE